MILGISCFFCIFSGLLIPETLHQTLPETIEDAKNFGIHQRFWSLPKKTQKANGVNGVNGIKHNNEANEDLNDYNRL